MRLTFTNFLTAGKTAFLKFIDKNPFRESAAISYYAIFSLPGLLFIITTLMTYFFGHPEVLAHFKTQLSSAFGAGTAAQIQNMIIAAGNIKHSFWPTVLGVVIIIIGATGVFEQFRQSLNTIWDVNVKVAGLGVWHAIKTRLLSFGIILSIAFLLNVSLLISAILSAFGSWLAYHFSKAFFTAVWAANEVLSFILITALFALLLKFMPEIKIRWRYVWMGAFVTAFLFEIGKFILAFYFGKSNPETGYGAAGSLILIMLWVYYSSLIVLYGAEFTRVYAEM